ncbi:MULTISPECIES: nitroreductase [Mycobacteriaceae]|uniref:nitroreductase n=1 Tax=Mycobacteriaceae TaxID=1762 RepID=UPI000800689A|nr:MULTISPECIES: nitroreductase [Mycobacteriaceae]MCK0177461.1 nitroreductase [Mycolicibacterium sp. F2034L]OBB61532.1 nitroreductase [Mycobacterium sp. 852013-51886_SCH5428379]
MATAFPDAATLDSALDLAARAPSIRNAQPWRWHVDRHGVRLFADWTRRLGDTDSDRRDVVLSCGAVLHHCAVAFAAAGWSSRISRVPADPADPADNVLATIELAPQPPGAGSLELARAIPLRRADRRPYAGSLPAGTIEHLLIRAERLGVRLAVVPAVRWTKVGDTDFALRYGDGPPDVADGDDAVMLVLATDSDGAADQLRAGEAISDLTLSIAALGLASCPLTDALRDTRSRLALACEVFDGDAHPQALMRLGARPTAEPLPPIDRRSVAETTTFSLN